MSNRRKVGIALLGLVAFAYMRPDLLEKIFPDVIPRPNPAPVVPDVHGFGKYLEGVTFQGDDKKKFAAMFFAIGDAIVEDGSLMSPRIPSKDDAADLAAVLLRYNKLNSYPLQPLAKAIEATVGPGDMDMSPVDRQKVGEVYKSVGAAFQNAR